MEEFIARSSGQMVRVATPQADELAKALAAAQGTVTPGADGTLSVRGLTAPQVGDIAFTQGVRLHELTVIRASLEAAFMELTADSVEYRADQPGQPIPEQITDTPAAVSGAHRRS
jgi:ABC-2 type transport system ATP-binding protein